MNHYLKIWIFQKQII